MDKIELLVNEKSNLRDESLTIKKTIYSSLFASLSILSIVFGFLLTRNVSISLENIHQIRVYCFVFNQIMFLLSIYIMTLLSSLEMISKYANYLNKEIKTLISLKSTQWEELANKYYFKETEFKEKGVQFECNLIISHFFALFYCFSFIACASLIYFVYPDILITTLFCIATAIEFYEIYKSRYFLNKMENQKNYFIDEIDSLPSESTKLYI
jgi:hypothetical protein